MIKEADPNLWQMIRDTLSLIFIVSGYRQKKNDKKVQNACQELNIVGHLLPRNCFESRDNGETDRQ